MNERDAQDIMAEIVALWPRMPMTDRLMARYVERLGKIHLDSERCIDVIHQHHAAQRAESKTPRVDPPMDTLIARLREIERGDMPSVGPASAPAERAEPEATRETWLALASEAERKGGAFGAYLARIARRRAENMHTREEPR